jgi:hypothetical protein
VKAWQLAFGIAAAVVSVTPEASAFCRTMTCDPQDKDENCEIDENECVTSGFPLSWRSSCVTVGIQSAGAPKNGFSYDDIAEIVEEAFGTWMAADCGNDQRPSIDVQLIGPIECNESEYNSKVGNANIVLFLEDDWPHIGAANAIGLTTTRFDTQSGALWDADMELNGFTGNLSIGDPIEGADLLSVITHEAGHFLGLSHSNEEEATMKALYRPGPAPGGDGTMFRSLDEDDIAGICAVYPPGRRAPTKSCVNRHGFSEQCGADQPPPNESKGCGCRLNARSGSAGSAGSAALALVLAAAARRRRVARRKVIV